MVLELFFQMKRLVWLYFLSMDAKFLTILHKSIYEISK